MTAHIPQRSCAEIIPGTPIEGMVSSPMKWTQRRGPDPIVPFETIWHRIGSSGSPHSLRPYRTIAPNVNLSETANGPSSDHFDSPAEIIISASLVSHLCYHSASLCQFPQIDRLLER